MKLTYLQMELISMNPATQSLLNKITGRLGLEIARSLDKIQREEPPLVTQMKKVQEKYGLKNEDGEFKAIKLPGGIEIIDFGDNKIKATEEILVLKSVEVDVPIEPINYTEDDFKDVTGAEFLAILPLLKIPEKQE